MHAGTHIPPYLLCEGLATGKVVVDVFPPDLTGISLLSRVAATSVAVVDAACGIEALPTGVHALRARPDALPLASECCDVALSLHPEHWLGRVTFADHVAALRSLVHGMGILVLRVPNADRLPTGKSHRADLPDFWTLEREMRHVFPHVSTFAQQPLFGAVLTPMGRRSADAPLLDDRMVPEEGEPPEYFVVIASATYLDPPDPTLAQLPFAPLAEELAQHTDYLESRLRLAQQERAARDRRIAQLTEENAALASQLAESQVAAAAKDLLEKKTALLESQLAKAKEELAQARAGQWDRSEKEQALLDRIRQLEQEAQKQTRQIEEASRTHAALRGEIDTLHQALDDRAEQLHQAKMLAAEKQRSLDAAVEEIAERDTEIAHLRSERDDLRNEMLAVRRRWDEAQQQIAEAETAHHRIAQLEAALEASRASLQELAARRTKDMASSQQALLDAFAEKESLVSQVHQLQLELRDKERRLTAALAETATNEDARRQAEEACAAVRAEKDALAAQLARVESALHEANALAQQRQDEVLRLSHAVETAQNQVRSRDEQLATLHQQLQDATEELGALRAERQQLRTEIAAAKGLEQELERLRQRLAQAESQAAESEALRARIAELTDAKQAAEDRVAAAQQRAAALQQEHHTLERRLLDTEVENLRLRTLEERYKAALEHIDTLQRHLGGEAGDNRQLRSEVARLHAALERAEQAQAERITQLEQALRAAEEQARSAQKAQQDAQSELAKANEDLASLTRLLAAREEDAGATIHTAAEKIRLLRAEVLRLKEENETELLAVREDLEVELRATMAQLEQAQQEIWELREEVVRLQAQSVAATAAAAHEGHADRLQQAIGAQEEVIERLERERSALRADNERLQRALEVRKKNLKILAHILRREHRIYTEYKRRIIDSDIPLPDIETDIAAAFVAHGGELTDEERRLFTDDASESRPTPAQTTGDAQDDAVVEAIMDSVVRRTQRDAESTSIIFQPPDADD